MKYFLILILLAVAVVYLLRRKKTAAERDREPVDATFICDECGERECICHEEKKRQDPL